MFITSLIVFHGIKWTSRKTRRRAQHQSKWKPRCPQMLLVGKLDLTSCGLRKPRRCQGMNGSWWRGFTFILVCCGSCAVCPSRWALSEGSGLIRDSCPTVDYFLSSYWWAAGHQGETAGRGAEFSFSYHSILHLGPPQYSLAKPGRQEDIIIIIAFLHTEEEYQFIQFK